GIEAGQAGAGADPEVACGIAFYAHREVVGQPVLLAVDAEAAGLRVEPVEPMASRDPQLAARVLEDVLHRVVAQAAGVVRVVTEVPKPAGARVEAVEPAARRAHPQVALAVEVQ